MPTSHTPPPQPQLSPGADAADGYRLVQGRIAGLLRGRPDVADLPVPACPAWTVRQTLAHLAGAAQDVASLNLDGAGTDEWTAAQVARLGRHGIDDLLDRWDTDAQTVAQRLAGGAPLWPAGQLVFDALTHEHDLRSALGEPGPRVGDLSYTVALSFLATTIDGSLRASGLPAFRLSTPALGAVTLGSPGPGPGAAATAATAALTLSDFEALRTFGGRRSLAQLLTLPWAGDPTPLLGPLSSYGGFALARPTADLRE